MGLFGRKKKTPIEAATAAAKAEGAIARTSAPKNQPVELGTIHYCNLTDDGKHGDYDLAVQASLETGKPIFANFVEWSG